MRFAYNARVLRYRMRFLLQEFDLVGPEIVLGRSSECQIIIEDPLISRRHAKVEMRSSGAWICDLGSRNGVRVNGRLIKGEQQLKDGDRVRLGTQELLFSAVGDAPRSPKATGYMRLCNACGTPYPEGSPSCSSCGTPATADEDTMTGNIAEAKRSWTFELMSEVVERALASGRSVEAERLMRRAAQEVDERLMQNEQLDATQVSTLAAAAIRLARLVGSSDWVAWALSLYRRQEAMLSDDVLDRLNDLDPHAFPDLYPLIDSFLAWYRARQARGLGPPTGELSRLVRLERLRRG